MHIINKISQKLFHGSGYFRFNRSQLLNLTAFYRFTGQILITIQKPYISLWSYQLTDDY